MTHQLPYLGLADKGESPRGYLLRTLLNNGYSTIGELAIRLGAAPTPAFLKTLLGTDEVVENLVKAHPNYSKQIKSAFYEQIKSHTDRGNIIFEGKRIPYKLLRTNEFHICEKCLHEKQLISSASDIAVIDVCLKHKSYLKHHCSSCNKPYNWRRTDSKCCSCNENEMELIADCRGAERVIRAIHDDEFDYLNRLLKILKALKHHKTKDKKERNEILNLAVSMLDEPSKIFRKYFQQLRQKYPGLPIHVLAAPFSAIQDNELTQSIENGLLQFPSSYPTKCGQCACSQNYLSIDETIVCLEITKLTLTKLCELGLIESFSPPTYKRTKVFPYKSLCAFFRNLLPTKTTQAVHDVRKITFTTPGHSLVEKLKNISEGTEPVISSDQRKGLSGVLVLEKESLKQVKEQHPELMTTENVANYLKVYIDAVRSLSKAELLKPVKTIATQHFYDTKEVMAFDKKYIFAASLAKKYDMKTRAITSTLNINKILPVVSAGYKDTITPLYLRDEVNKPDLFKIKYSDYREKMSHNTKQVRYLYPNYMTAKEIAKALKLHVSSISMLVKVGLLKQIHGKTAPKDNRRLFSKESFNKTKKWFSTAIKIEDLAEQLQVNVWLIKRLFISTQYITPLKISGGDVFISESDQQKVLRHHSKFCTCTQADEFHHAPEKHFHNLVKSGRFPAVNKEDYLCDTKLVLLYWDDVKKYSS